MVVTRDITRIRDVMYEMKPFVCLTPMETASILSATISIEDVKAVASKRVILYRV